MAAAYRNHQTANATSGSSLTVNKPTGTAAGDFLLILATHSSPGGTSNPFSVPTGFTQIYNGDAGGYRFGVFYRVADGSEASTFTVNRSGGNGGCSCLCVAYSGASLAYDTASTSGSAGAASTTATAAALTTAQNDEMILYLEAGSGFNTPAGGVTPPTGYTERADMVFDASAWAYCYLAEKAQTTAGTTGTPAATGFNRQGTVALVAIKGAAAVAPVADFTGTPLTGVEPLSVAFTDASTNAPTSWAWTFGDGGTSSSQNPSHSYTVAGTYTVTLQATNATGSNTKTRTGYVVVGDQPRPVRINTSGGWVDIADQSSFVSGTGPPTAAVGATGAIYLDTASGRMYGPKAAGAWPSTSFGKLLLPGNTYADVAAGYANYAALLAG